MQVIVKLLRERGVIRSRAIVEAQQWTEDYLRDATVEGRRCLGLYGILLRPDLPPLAALFAPTIVRVVENSIVVRGIEQVQLVPGQRAAVVQEWLVQQRPMQSWKGERPDIRKDFDG